MRSIPARRRLSDAPRRSERAGAGPDQHRDIVRLPVRGGEVRLAVAVQVGDRHLRRLRAHLEVDGGGERATALTEHDRDGVGETVGGDDVALAVAVEVGDRNAARELADRNGTAGGPTGRSPPTARR